MQKETLPGHCQYGRRGQSYPNQHPSMCFKFLHYGTRGCYKLDCTYSHPKMCKTALTTGRCDRKNCFYYHKTGTISLDRFPISQLQAKVDPPFLWWSWIFLRTRTKMSPIPPLNHKASPPHTTTPPPQSFQQNTTSKQQQTQATWWDLPIATHSLLPQSHLSNNYHHLPTQHPTVETITPKSSSNSQSVTNLFLDQMNAIKQLMLDMQQAQSKLLLNMNEAWPLLQTNKIL